MISLPGNPHFEDANLDGFEVPYRQAQATLALAFEQRTATLVSIHQFAARLMLGGEIKGDVNGAAERLDALSDEINERIGKTE